MRDNKKRSINGRDGKLCARDPLLVISLNESALTGETSNIFNWFTFSADKSTVNLEWGSHLL